MSGSTVICKGLTLGIWIKGSGGGAWKEQTKAYFLVNYLPEASENS